MVQPRPSWWVRSANRTKFCLIGRWFWACLCIWLSNIAVCLIIRMGVGTNLVATCCYGRFDLKFACPENYIIIDTTIPDKQQSIIMDELQKGKVQRSICLMAANCCTCIRTDQKLNVLSTVFSDASLSLYKDSQFCQDSCLCFAWCESHIRAYEMKPFSASYHLCCTHGMGPSNALPDDLGLANPIDGGAP